MFGMSNIIYFHGSVPSVRLLQCETFVVMQLVENYIAILKRKWMNIIKNMLIATKLYSFIVNCQG